MSEKQERRIRERKEVGKDRKIEEERRKIKQGRKWENNKGG